MALSADIMRYHNPEGEFDDHRWNRDPNGAHMEFARRESTEMYDPAILIGVEPGGASRVRDLPPRDRGMVIGVGLDNRIVIGFPSHGNHSDGYHHIAKPTVINILGRENVKAIFHADIHPEGRIREKATHTISIHRMSEKDRQKLADNQPDIYAAGQLYPERFMDDSIAQRIMRTMRADRLEVAEAPSSSSIYSKPLRENVVFNRFSLPRDRSGD